MQTLVIKTVDAVSNPDIFKRLGYSNFKYTANLAAIDPVKPPVVTFNFFAGSGETRIEIDGATMYKVNGATPDLATPYAGVITLTTAELGDRAIAFIPTKTTGYIRIKGGSATKIDDIGAFYTANDSVLPYLDLDEFQSPMTSINNFATIPAAGYKKTYVLSGDINNLSKNAAFKNFYLSSDSQIVQKLSNTNWNEKIKSTTVRTVELISSIANLSVDVSIFPSTMTIGLTIVMSKGITLYGNIDALLSYSYKILLRDNLSQDGITGTINSLSTNRISLDVNAPNLTGGYTTRTYTGAITLFRILSTKVTTADYDLLLSDLANKAPNLAANALIQVSRRSSASDASVAALQAKGCSVIVGG